MMKVHLAILATSVMLAGCGTNTGWSTANESTTATSAPVDDNATAPASTSAVAHIRTADGKDVGTATATDSGGAIQVTWKAVGMPAGSHGIHIHAVGACDGPKFTSAGAHWNPMGKLHGTENPKGPHAGDIPNLTVAPDGSGTVTATLPAGTITGLLDADGSAFVVHAKPDDYKTDPSGDSGDRIACGVFAAG